MSAVSTSGYSSLVVPVSKQEKRNSEDDGSTTDGEFDDVSIASASNAEVCSSGDEFDRVEGLRFGHVEVVEVPAPDHLRTWAENETIDAFLEELRQRHGTVLRAWRMEIDVRSSGKVSYVDFVRQCRQIGTAVQSKQLWSALSPKDAPLEFASLCPEEAANLESFSKVLCSNFGTNSSKAWDFFDSSHQNWVSLREFLDAAAELSFSGDTKLLFRGIDSSKLGRICHGDLEYLLKLAEVRQHTGSTSSREMTKNRARLVLASARSNARAQFGERPVWNNSVCDMSAKNRSNCTAARSYFSKPSKERIHMPRVPRLSSMA